VLRSVELLVEVRKHYKILQNSSLRNSSKFCFYPALSFPLNVSCFLHSELPRILTNFRPLFIPLCLITAVLNFSQLDVQLGHNYINVPTILQAAQQFTPRYTTTLVQFAAWVALTSNVLTTATYQWRQLKFIRTGWTLVA
jgi:hypothetical protein